MTEPFVAEIKIFACNFAPYGWAFCNGQIMPIAQNTALFSLVGIYYGGDGHTNFGLPDLQASARITLASAVSIREGGAHDIVAKENEIIPTT